MRYTGRHVQRLRVYVYHRDHGICAICHHPASFNAGHVDHIIPRRDGGTHDPTNLRWTHARCNLERGARPIGGGAASTSTGGNPAAVSISLPGALRSREW